MYFIDRILTFPSYVMYHTYDKLLYNYFNQDNIFQGWGIHLYTGAFGSCKTSSLVARAYRLCNRYPQLQVLTNINITNFPEWTVIKKLNTANDIINAEENTLVLIDELGTIFNARDFMQKDDGKKISKELIQSVAQCRHRRVMILGTAQYYRQVDKQVREITATVISCTGISKHPFTRLMINDEFDRVEYDIFCDNPMYAPKPLHTSITIQTNEIRQLYDTRETVSQMLKMEHEDFERVSVSSDYQLGDSIEQYLKS